MKPSPNTENEPNRKDTRVVVHFPDEVGIELVQANELRHYELFLWLAGIISSIAVSFWTAYFTSDASSPLLLSACAFSIIALVFVFLGYRYRRKIYHGSIVKKVSLTEFK